MITGHFTTALVPYAGDRKMPLFILLVIVQLQDLLIPLDIFLSKETDLMKLEMTYSHDLVPALFMALLAGGIIHLIYRNRRWTAWVVGLVGFHEICDLFSGFAHNVWGLSTWRLGFDFYRQAPLTAYVIELGLALICTGYFLRQNRIRGIRPGKLKTGVLLGVIFLPILISIGLAANGKTLF